jgi:glycosyltransferase involved in cell wall biosynthesis
VKDQVIGHFIAAKAQAPHVSTQHVGSNRDGHIRPFRRHQGVLLRLFAPRVDLVIAVSASQISSLVNLGFRRECIRVIPNALPSNNARATRSRPDARRSLMLGESDFVALFVGTLRPEKRGPMFVRAVKEAHAINPRIRGLVAGDGPELACVQELAARATSGVRVLGGRADVPELLNAADVLCLCSTYEALPMSALEAMAASRPVVASDVGGVRDLVVPEETGLLFDPDDEDAFVRSLVRLAENPALARRLGSAGNERQRKMVTIDGMVDAYANAFKEARRLQADRRGIHW